LQCSFSSQFCRHKRKCLNLSQLLQYCTDSCLTVPYFLLSRQLK
jgi:hypothetical protein